MYSESKPSKEALRNRYLVRFIKRIIRLVSSLFVLFLVVMGIIWAIPRVLSWVLG